MIWEALRSLFADRDGDAPVDGRAPPRQLVLLLDGTGNSITGGKRDTNVLKLYQALLQFAVTHERDDLHLYYDPGVGSPDQLPSTGPADQFRRTWERVIGLAEGGGIFENVIAGYTFLMRQYRPGDEIFVFGFSRGAFTARAIAGLVQMVGIMNEDSEQLLPLLARVYFSSPQPPGERIASATAVGRLQRRLGAKKVTREDLARQIKTDFTSGDRQAANVQFIGVWDTVDSVGLPGFSKRITSPPTARDKEHFLHIRQALSLDEHRATFKPRVYADDDYDLVDAGDPPLHRTLEQRWFPGAHSDVGGGYEAEQAGLSAAALEWIVREACAKGLARDPATGRLDAQELLGRIARRTPESVGAPRRRHDELLETPWWALAGMTLRVPGPLGATTPLPYAPPDAAAAPPGMGSRLAFAAVGLAFALVGLQTALGGGFASLFRVRANFAALRAYAGEHLRIVTFDFAAAPGCCGATFEDGLRAPWMFWKALAARGDFGWALAWEMLAVLALGYFVAAVTGRAFVRWAGPALPGTRPSGWTIVGVAPALAILAWCLKDVAWLLALASVAVGVNVGAGLLFVVGVAAVFVALIGWLGCAVLLLMGLTRRPRAWLSP